MQEGLLHPKLQALRGVVDDLVKDLHALAVDTGSEELAGTVSDLRARVAEPFLFVVVGEVKAGKSAFVNAMLGAPRSAEITPTAPDPKTDRITQIVYGDAVETLEVNPHLRKVLFPAPILREISVVDTPGTNTLLEHHQEITERFVPGSDLVVFVFEGKNPYRRSAWDFFDFIHGDWKKKSIFVLQQVDLLTAEELRVNLEGVRKHARERGLDDPPVFAVSAKRELDGERDASGFAPLRAWVQANVTGGRSPFLKLQNVLATSDNLVARVRAALARRRERLAADEAFRAEVRTMLDAHEARALAQVDLLADALGGAYDRTTGAARARVATGLGFFALTRRSLLAMFSRESSVGEWLKRVGVELEGALREELGARLDQGVKDLAGNVHPMASELDAHVARKLADERVPLRRTEEIFGQVAEQRSLILLQLRDRMATFLGKDGQYLREDLFPAHVPFSPDLATGGGVAALGVVLTALTQGAVFDVTGGVLTAVGLLFAGVATRVRRGRLLAALDEEIERGRARLAGRVRDELGAYVRDLRAKLERSFEDFDALLAREHAAIEAMEGRAGGLAERVERTRKEVDACSPPATRS